MNETNYILELNYKNQDLEVHGIFQSGIEAKFTITKNLILGTKVVPQLDIKELQDYILKTKFKK